MDALYAFDLAESICRLRDGQLVHLGASEIALRQRAVGGARRARSPLCAARQRLSVHQLNGGTESAGLRALPNCATRSAICSSRLDGSTASMRRWRGCRGVVMSRGSSNGPRQPGGGRQQAGPRGRGHGRDRDERIKERSKERSNPRQSDLRVKHSPKRDGGRGRAFPARPPREQPVAFAARAAAGGRAEAGAIFGRRANRHRHAPTRTACASTASSRRAFPACRSATSSASSAKARCA